ncbi:MAG: hypothetical protein WA417_23560 [Stellaceae bacterium]
MSAAIEFGLQQIVKKVQSYVKVRLVRNLTKLVICALFCSAALPAVGGLPADDGAQGLAAC